MAKVTSLEAMLLKIQFRWARHVSRMEDHRLPKAILNGELSTALAIATKGHLGKDTKTV